MPSSRRSNITPGPAVATTEAAAAENIAVAEEEAALTIVHDVPQVGFRYSWRKNGKIHYYEVIRETWKTVAIKNTEFLMGRSRHFVNVYREDVLLSSNDPRISKTIDKDPGPKVWLLGPDGTEKIMNANEFMTLINDKQALKTQVS